MFTEYARSGWDGYRRFDDGGIQQVRKNDRYFELRRYFAASNNDIEPGIG
jgi:hypothetical protein